MSALGRPHTIRSWLGVGGPTPRTSHITHSLTEWTHTMRHANNTARLARTRLAVLLTGVAVTAAGLTIGATLPPQGVGAPTPSPTASFRCEEDMPCWDARDCAENGNRICASDEYAAAAWKTWDEQDGARLLKVDPSRPFRVDYMMSTDGVPENTDTYDLVLTGKDGRSYVFRANYTDGI